MFNDSGDDDHLMRRALELAARGRGHAEPNPLVGCVIARDDRVLGEGFHERFGGAHAEINALAACSEDPAGATAHVTLEPCCHTDKKTGPCVPRLIEARIARVVIGCLDPNPPVSGQGAEQLRAAGIQVDVGMLETQCRQMNAPYFARTIHRRPYVTLKWAQSADGKVAGRAGRPMRITNEAATEAVHVLRGLCNAIAIGTNTLVNDDPLLTARTPNPPRRPMRVVLSNRLSFPAERRLFASPQDGPVVLFTTAARADSSEAAALRARGVEIVGLMGADNGRGEGRFAMRDVYADLGQRGVTHLMIEPGPKLARELMGRSEADRALIISGQVTIGQDGMAAARCDWRTTGTIDLDGDSLSEHLNAASEAYFAPEHSADVLMLGTPLEQSSDDG